MIIARRFSSSHGSAFHVQRICRRALGVNPVTGHPVRPLARPTRPPSQRGAGPCHCERSFIPPGVATRTCRLLPSGSRGFRVASTDGTLERGCDAQRADLALVFRSAGHERSVTDVSGRQRTEPDNPRNSQISFGSRSPTPGPRSPCRRSARRRNQSQPLWRSPSSGTARRITGRRSDSSIRPRPGCPSHCDTGACRRPGSCLLLMAVNHLPQRIPAGGRHQFVPCTAEVARQGLRKPGTTSRVTTGRSCPLPLTWLLGRAVCCQAPAHGSAVALPCFEPTGLMLATVCVRR